MNFCADLALPRIAISVPASSAGKDGQVLIKEWQRDLERSQAPASRPYDERASLELRWRQYLAQMTDLRLARATEQFMAAARQVATISVPTALPFDGEGIQLAWDVGEHHLDVDLFGDGTFEWFYRNRSTDELDGTDQERASGIPDELASRLRSIAT